MIQFYTYLFLMIVLTSFAFQLDTPELSSLIQIWSIYLWIYLLKNNKIIMPIFKCNICRRDIERSRDSYIQKKGYLLCSSCFDKKIKNKNVN